MGYAVRCISIDRESSIICEGNCFYYWLIFAYYSSAFRRISFLRDGGTHLRVPSIRTFSCSVKCRVYGPYCFVVLFIVVMLKLSEEKNHVSALP